MFIGNKIILENTITPLTELINKRGFRYSIALINLNHLI